MTEYDTFDIPVRGGQLRVGGWASTDVARGAVPTRVVVAAHGITANHTAWWPLARALTAHSGTVLLAPDLRGRGRSADLPGPWGVATHADDLASVLDHRDLERVDVVGHSSGAFIAVEFAARHRDRVGRVVLLDGGVPYARPDGMTAEEALAAALGSTAARLAMTFESREAYRDLFRAHPAIGPLWDEDYERFVDYDYLDGRSRVVYDAVAQDSTEVNDDGPAPAAWQRIDGRVRLLRAPRGMFAAPPGVYAPEALAAFAADHPNVEVRVVDDVDHFGVQWHERGVAATVAALVED